MHLQEDSAYYLVFFTALRALAGLSQISNERCSRQQKAGMLLLKPDLILIVLPVQTSSPEERQNRDMHKPMVQDKGCRQKHCTVLLNHYMGFQTTSS